MRRLAGRHGRLDQVAVTADLDGLDRRRPGPQVMADADAVDDSGDTVEPGSQRIRPGDVARGQLAARGHYRGGAPVRPHENPHGHVPGDERADGRRPGLACRAEGAETAEETIGRARRLAVPSHRRIRGRTSRRLEVIDPQARSAIINLVRQFRAAKPGLFAPARVRGLRGPP